MSHAWYRLQYQLVRVCMRDGDKDTAPHLMHVLDISLARVVGFLAMDTRLKWYVDLETQNLTRWNKSGAIADCPDYRTHIQLPCTVGALEYVYHKSGGVLPGLSRVVYIELELPLHPHYISRISYILRPRCDKLQTNDFIERMVRRFRASNPHYPRWWGTYTVIIPLYTVYRIS